MQPIESFCSGFRFLFWAGPMKTVEHSRFYFPKISLLVLVPCSIGWLLFKLFARIAQVINIEWGRPLPMLCIYLFFSRCVTGLIKSGKTYFYPKIFTVLPYALGFVMLVHPFRLVFFRLDGQKKDIQVAQFFCFLRNRLHLIANRDHFVF